MKLYELSDNYNVLLNRLYDEETGLINEEVLNQIQEIGDSIQDKCINVTRFFKQVEAERKAIEAERKAMAIREKALKNQVERLKQYLLANMERCEINEIKCPQFIIKVQKNPPSVSINDELMIPDKYRKVTIDYDIQKMKDDMQFRGIDIPGATLVQKNSIRIR